MAFSEQTKKDAYARAGGKCECTREICGHYQRCNKPLGNDWHAHHKTAVAKGGGDGLSNCEALCKECHYNTESFGRPSV